MQKDLQDGQAAGVSGTPGFFVNGLEVRGAQPFSVFQQVIEAALAEAGEGCFGEDCATEASGAHQ